MAKEKVKVAAQESSEQVLQRLENLIGPAEVRNRNRRRASILEEVQDVIALVEHQQEQINALMAQIGTLNDNIMVLQDRIENHEQGKLHNKP